MQYNIFDLYDVKVRNQRTVKVKVDQKEVIIKPFTDAKAILQFMISTIGSFLWDKPDYINNMESKLEDPKNKPSKQEMMRDVYEILIRQKNGITIVISDNKEEIGCNLSFELSEEVLSIEVQKTKYYDDLKSGIKENKLRASKEFFLLLLLESLNANMKSKEDMARLFLAVDSRGLYHEFFQILEAKGKNELINGMISLRGDLIKKFQETDHAVFFEAKTNDLFHEMVKCLHGYSISRVIGWHNERRIVSTVLESRLAFFKSQFGI